MVTGGNSSEGRSDVSDMLPEKSVPTVTNGAVQVMTEWGPRFEGGKGVCYYHGPMVLVFSHIYHCGACCAAGGRCYEDA